MPVKKARKLRAFLCAKVNQMLSKEEVAYKNKSDFDCISYDFTARSGAFKVTLINIDRSKI